MLNYRSTTVCNDRRKRMDRLMHAWKSDLKVHMVDVNFNRLFRQTLVTKYSKESFSFATKDNNFIGIEGYADWFSFV